MKFAMFIVGLALGFALGLGVMFVEQTHKWQQKAIELGHAQYNPTNANFEWKAVK